MWLRLRQICLVARDIERVTAELQSVFGLAVCHVDPHVGKYGLVNRLLPIGNQLLEIVAPIAPATAAGRYLERRGGDGGYMIITQCDDHAPRKRRVADLGVRIANTIDRNGFHGMQLHPKDTGGSFFEIDFQEGGDAPDGPWEPAGPEWRSAVRTGVIDAITAAELQSPDPEGLASRWSRIAEIAIERNCDGVPELALENARVRFVPAADGRGEGLGGIDVRAVDPGRALDAARAAGCPVDGTTIVACGTRFRLV
jgi:hypothetical protein